MRQRRKFCVKTGGICVDPTKVTWFSFINQRHQKVNSNIISKISKIQFSARKKVVLGPMSLSIRLSC